MYLDYSRLNHERRALMLKTGRLLFHDPQSRNYEYPRRTVQPRSVMHRIDARALDQGNLSACTGFAAAQWLNCRPAYGNRQRYRKPYPPNKYANYADGVGLYMQATHQDEFPWVYPPADEGSSGLGVAKALKYFGAIDRYEHTFSFPAFLAALQAQPVLLGTVWPDSLFDPDRNGIIRVTSTLVTPNGHEYLAHGINWPRRMIRIRNGWSMDWGIDGDAYISFDDMELLLGAQGDCTVPIVVAA